MESLYVQDAKPFRLQTATWPIHRIVLLLVLIDLLFVGADVASKTVYLLGYSEAHSVLLDIGRDEGLAERWNVAKWGAAAVAFAIAAIRLRRIGFLIFAAVPALLMADDGLQIHEQMGLRVGLMVGMEPGTGAQNGGELIFAVLLAIAVFGLIYLGARTSSSCVRAAKWLAALIFVLAVFGVGIDFLHSLVALPFDAPRVANLAAALDYGFGLVEDGGELIVTSAILALAAFYAKRPRLEDEPSA